MIAASAPQQFTAGALAMVVHLFFFAALVFGVSWKTMPALPVYADLWQALPELAPPPPPEPEPMPEPEPVPAPEIKPPPPPKPAAPVEKAPPKVDIALKEKEEKRKRLEEEKRRQQELELRKQEELRLREEALKEEQRLEELKRKEEARKVEERRLAQERLRKELERAMAEQMAADLAEERSQLAEAQALAAAAAARDKMILDYRARISLKIRALIRLPANLKGNPEAVFKVRLLPNGEVLNVTLVKSSGQPAYDQEVERAILKASPLPLPPDREAAAIFRDNLQLKFRPQEG